MAKLEKQKQTKDWAEKLASKYNIFPETVIGILKGFSGTKRYKMDNNEAQYISHKERTEEFLELYFKGVKGE